VSLLEWRFWPDFYWDERVGYYTVAGRGHGAGHRYVQRLDPAEHRYG